VHGGRLAEGRTHFERAVEADPRSARAHAALGEVAGRQGRWAEARREVALALAADPGDALALFRYADLIVRETAARGEVLSEAREAEAVAALERAVALAPQMGDACLLLARLRPAPYGERIAQVRAALAREPTRADLGFALASLYAQRNDLAAARAALVRTRALARDEVSRFLGDHLLARLDGFTAGTAEARGTLAALECRPGGALRFVVSGAGGALRLDAPSANSVFLYAPDGSPVERTFTCGAQGDKVVARYRPQSPPARGGPDGTLISLTFEAPGSSR
jgi:cellulose synthase operon protein C